MIVDVPCQYLKCSKPEAAQSFTSDVMITMYLGGAVCWCAALSGFMLYMDDQTCDSLISL